MAANFKLNNDGHGGTLIKDPPAASPANVALFGNYIAAGFPEPAAWKRHPSTSLLVTSNSAGPTSAYLQVVPPCQYDQ